MVDLYTKAVLTVIAAALTLLAAQGLIRPVEAQTGVQKVQICDKSDCLSLTPHTIRMRGSTRTDWVLPMQIDGVQKVEICRGPSDFPSCAGVDPDFRAGGSLRVSSR